jgi:TolB-like protein/Flp pilus assembly protein TadD
MAMATGPENARLDSWKDIAAYLKRSVSTVQRWERQEGLPVHRHLHGKLGSIYAYPSEVDAWWRVSGQNASASEVRPSARGDTIASIAVLPFADMSPQHDQDYLCEGLAEEILNSLTRVDGLRVASRTSSFQFKGAPDDVRRIGERLNVRCVLEGSVRRAGQRFRVTVQLIDVANGYHLWSERYDREVADVFALEDEIAESTARALSLVLSGQQGPLRQAKTTDFEAYQFYLRGRQVLNEYSHRSVHQSREMFARAVAIDPNYALAHTGVADASAWLVMWLAGTESDLRQAEEASARALALAPGLAESHASRGLVLMLGRRYDEAESHFRRAIELNPRSFDGHYYYSRALFSTGRFADAEPMMRRAAELRLEDYQTVGLLSLILRKLGRLQEAEAATREGFNRIERYLEINPRDPRALYHGGHRLREMGRREEAREWIERARAVAPGDPAVLYNAACFYSVIGERDRALDVLEEMAQSDQAGTSKDWMANDPDLDPLRELPRFQAILGRLP